jgi:uncharacterized membrane protein YwzB
VIHNPIRVLIEVSVTHWNLIAISTSAFMRNPFLASIDGHCTFVSIVHTNRLSSFGLILFSEGWGIVIILLPREDIMIGFTLETWHFRNEVLVNEINQFQTDRMIYIWSM